MTKKVKFILLFSFFIIIGLCTKSEARITTSDPTVSSGETATITINSQEPVANGSIDVTSDGGLTFVSVSGGTSNGTLVAFAGTENKTNGLVTYTFRVPEVTETTTYQVTFSSADMADAEGQTVASSSATSTVTVRVPETSSGGDSGNNGSSGNNSSGSDSDDNENTPTVSFSSRNETVYATGSVNVRASYSTNSRVIGSLSEGDSLTRTGISDEWSRVTYEGQTAYVINSGLTTTKPATEEEPDEEKPEETDEEKSNVKTLSSLTVEQYSLEPEFSPDITEYSLTVGGDVEKLDIGAIAEDTNATIEITGNTGLLIGENTINVKVTAEDGTVRTYTINVTKLADVGVKYNRYKHNKSYHKCKIR